jgi:hypothetical protein
VDSDLVSLDKLLVVEDLTRPGVMILDGERGICEPNWFVLGFLAREDWVGVVSLCKKLVVRGIDGVVGILLGPSLDAGLA